MSKGTIRLPEGAIADGRIGTARIREQIAGAAARLESREPMPLDRALVALSGAVASMSGTSVGRVIADFADAPSYSPIERMQQLGRLPRGKMNKTEAAYAQLLDARRAAGAIADFKFESVKLRLADRTWYMPDFCVFMHDGTVEMHEVKGFMTDDANVKLKVAADLYSQHIFRLVRKGKKGTWTITPISAR